MTKDQLLEKANSLPLAPGVYLMHDKAGTVIYVGKAKKLKNRVSQYFQAGRGHNLKTHTMVGQVDTFDTILVGSEFEALVLENALIKQYMPRYNILLKDDKGYPLVRLSREPYPKFTLVSRPAEDGAKYFGPYGGRMETRSALDAIRRALHLPTCHKTFPRDIGKERPCLNHHMGRCDGFCRAEMTAEEYNRRMDLAVQLLEGKVRMVTAQLEQEMLSAAEDLRFEEAAALRDRIEAIKVLGKRQKIIAGVCSDSDVWGLYLNVKGCYAVLHYEEGQLTGKEAEVFSTFDLEAEGEILSALLLQYYGSRRVLPREICIPAAIEDQEVLEQLLSEQAGHKVAIKVPQRGERAQVMRMAADNAREEAERQTSSQERSDRTLELLAVAAGVAGVLRHLQHRRRRHRGLHGGLPRLETGQGPLSPLPHQGAGRPPGRLPLHGGGPHPPPDPLYGAGQALPAPAGRVPHRRRGAARQGGPAGGEQVWPGCAHFRHGEGRPPPHPGPRHPGGPGDRHPELPGGIRPDRAHPGGDPPLRNYLQPPEPRQKRAWLHAG